MGLINRQQKQWPIQIRVIEDKPSLPEHPFIGSIGQANETAPYTIDNPYLLHGYRCNYNTKTLCFLSLFECHNETCNMWTHLIPFVGALFSCLYVFIFEQPPFITLVQGGTTYESIENTISVNSIKLFWVTAIYLYGGSFLYHTFFCVQESVSNYLLRFDYSGICMIASGGTIPTIIFGFHCQPLMRDFLVFTNISISVLLIGLSMMDFMHSQEFLRKKVFLYGSFFATILIPITYLIIFKYYPGNLDLSNVSYWLLMMLANQVIGITVYLMRFPEKYYPNQFDFYMSSHQIWHIFVIIANICCYFSILNIFIERSNNNQCL